MEDRWTARYVPGGEHPVVLSYGRGGQSVRMTADAARGLRDFLAGLPLGSDPSVDEDHRLSAVAAAAMAVDKAGRG